MSAVRLLVLYHAGVPEAALVNAVEALGLISSSEDYHTYRSTYVHSESDALTLMELRSSCLNKLQDDLAARRAVRPLVDCVLQVGRQYNMK